MTAILIAISTNNYAPGNPSENQAFHLFDSDLTVSLRHEAISAMK